MCLLINKSSYWANYFDMQIEITTKIGCELKLDQVGQSRLGDYNHYVSTNSMASAFIHSKEGRLPLEKRDVKIWFIRVWKKNGSRLFTVYKNIYQLLKNWEVVIITKFWFLVLLRRKELVTSPQTILKGS